MKAKSSSVNVLDTISASKLFAGADIVRQGAGCFIFTMHSDTVSVFVCNQVVAQHVEALLTSDELNLVSIEADAKALEGDAKR